MTTTAIDPPLCFAGVPAGSWAFGIRIWLAVVVALAASFWLELEVPSTAAVTVAILAEPTAQPILGHVTSVTRGIGVSDAAAGTQGLPNVDPVYTWVRLAQRVPVRIAIDSVPPGIPLVSGMTATVRIKDAASAEGRTWLDRAVSAIETRLSDVLNGRYGLGAFPRRRPGERQWNPSRCLWRRRRLCRNRSIRVSRQA